MRIELRDVIAILSILVAAGSMLIVSRNARRATAVQTENTDLARIRDLRAELRETRDELDRGNRLRADMLRYARTPGMDLERWLSRFGTSPPALDATLDS